MEVGWIRRGGRAASSARGKRTHSLVTDPFRAVRDSLATDSIRALIATLQTVVLATVVRS